MIWITRPHPSNLETARRIEALGGTVFLEPLLTIERLPFMMPEIKPWGIVVTSQHAVWALDQIRDKTLPVFCVGEKTAEQVRAQGFAHIIVGDNRAQSLVALIREHPFADSSLLYLSGQDISFPLSAALEEQGIHIVQHIVYKAHAVGALSGALRQALTKKKISDVLLFSERTAKIFHERMRQDGLLSLQATLRIVAWSEDIGQVIRSLGWKCVDFSFPDEEAFYSLVQHTFFA